MADALSRADVATLSPDESSTIDFSEMASAQHNDPDLLQAQASSSLDLKPVPLSTAAGTSSVIFQLEYPAHLFQLLFVDAFFEALLTQEYGLLDVSSPPDLHEY